LGNVPGGFVSGVVLIFYPLVGFIFNQGIAANGNNSYFAHNLGYSLSVRTYVDTYFRKFEIQGGAKFDA
jgi:hypothetical protein